MNTGLFQYAKFGLYNDSIAMAGTRWDGAKLILIQAAPPFSPNPLSSEFVPTDFDGYVEKTIVTADYVGVIGTDGQVSIYIKPQTWVCTADNASLPVIGWALLNAAKDNVLDACIFDVPVNMQLQNNTLVLVAQLNIPTIMDQPNTAVSP